VVEEGGHMRLRISVAVLMAIVSVSVSLIRCNGEKEYIVGYFPVEIGNWWEHEYRFLVVVYDTVVNDTSENLYVDSLHDEITGTDSLAGWSCYRFHETSYDDTRWYAHPDSALLFIASLIEGDSGFVACSSRETSYGLHGAIFGTISDLASYMENVIFGLGLNLDTDTMYITPPQKYYLYPMRVGTSWVRMTEPWYEEREVVAAESVTVPAGTFYTLKLRVQSDLGIEDERYIWISEEGMIRDSIYSRGVAINTFGDTIGYLDVYTMYDLLSLSVK
jgi:hypothetical protein